MPSFSSSQLQCLQLTLFNARLCQLKILLFDVAVIPDWKILLKYGSELFALLLHSVYYPVTSVFAELQLLKFIENNYIAEAVWEGWGS